MREVRVNNGYFATAIGERKAVKMVKIVAALPGVHILLLLPCLLYFSMTFLLMCFFRVSFVGIRWIYERLINMSNIEHQKSGFRYLFFILDT